MQDSEASHPRLSRTTLRRLFHESRLVFVLCPVFKFINPGRCNFVKMRGLVATIALLGAGSAWPLAAKGTPSVDLGYAVYEGTHDSKNGINVFKGYAQ